ncbi:MAG: AMP-binding protein, partial [Actinobacteria bacterium]|nr:AMP-binding protein [Actinomycetota bacterium]
MDEASPRPRLTRVADALFTARTLLDAGIAHPDRPDRLIRAGLALRRWGPTPAAGYAASAARTPDRTAIDDELGTMTFAALHQRTNALARSLREAGVGEGDGVGILARNHRGFVESTVACSKLGANALYLNTAFAGPQISDVVGRERPAALIHDEEFTELCAEASEGRPTFLAWEETGGGGSSRPPTLEDLIGAGAPLNLRPPARPGKVVILTSGTTGAPKGASRRQPDSLAPAAALLS